MIFTARVSNYYTENQSHTHTQISTITVSEGKGFVKSRRSCQYKSIRLLTHKSNCLCFLLLMKIEFIRIFVFNISRQTIHIDTKEIHDV